MPLLLSINAVTYSRMTFLGRFLQPFSADDILNRINGFNLQTEQTKMTTAMQLHVQRMCYLFFIQSSVQTLTKQSPSSVYTVL